MLITVMMGVALDGEFDARCPILDRDGRGTGSEINHIRRRLVLSLHTLLTDIPNNSSAIHSFQFQRELQELFWFRAFPVH